MTVTESRSGGAVAHLAPGEHQGSRPQLAPKAWVDRLRQYQSIVITATVFAIVGLVVVAHSNISVLDTLYGLQIGQFSAADEADLSAEDIVESARTQSLIAHVNRPVQPFADSTVSDPGAEVQTAVDLPVNDLGLRTYRVVAGDSVWGIANRMGLQPTTIQWSTPDLDPNAHLQIGKILFIPPVDGAVHKIVSGDTLSSLANRYQVEIGDIVAYPLNGLETINTPLSVGREILIPGGTKPPPPKSTIIRFTANIPDGNLRGTGRFAPAITGAQITQGFWSGHRAIDYATRLGSPIRAVDHGMVAHASFGWNYGYGNLVVVDHGNGFSSLYAHMATIAVKKGDAVQQGQQVGTLGNTGNSTGPHLHLEIRHNGEPQNPLSYIPG